MQTPEQPSQDLEPEIPENSNTIGVAGVMDSGDLAEVQMILGSRERVRHAGIIRPGIKVPVQSCTQDQVKTYHALLNAGASFASIDQKLIEMRPRTPQGRDARTWLKPANADHFTIRPEDFRRPADAARIAQTYMDADGKVRTIPVWFALGELHLVIPHSFRGFSGGGVIRFASYHCRDGSLRCRYVPASVQVPTKADYRERPCPGLDDPHKCPDYEARRCAFGGLIRCNVPGVSGVGEIIVPTNSWYGLGESVANLRRVREVFGRFHGLFRRKPFLQLAKVQEHVRTADGKRQEQWIIVVEPAVPLEELASAREEDGPARAKAALSVFAPRHPIGPSDAGKDEPQAEHGPEPLVQTQALPLREDLANGKISPACAEAVEHIARLAKHFNYPMDHVRALGLMEFGIVLLENTEISVLRNLYQYLVRESKKDPENLRAVLYDCANTHTAST